MIRLAILALPLAILLAGCTPPDAPQQAAPVDSVVPAPQSPDATVTPPAPPIETVSDAIGATVAAVVDAATVVVEPRIIPPPAVPLLDEDCVDLLVRLEVGSVRLYRQRYYMPIHPSAESGVTIGLGYDLRYVTEQMLRTDWQRHAQIERLVGSVGLYGKAADQAVAQLSDVTTPFELAKAVFIHSTAPQYFEISRRQFGAGFDALDRDYQCGLFLITYNRGGSMTGLRRAELRAIRDECVPSANKPCAASENRKSKRLWRGTPIQGGMDYRREAESVRIERSN